MADVALLVEREREERALAASARSEAARKDHEMLADCYRAVIERGAAGQTVSPFRFKSGPGEPMADWL